MDANVLEGHQYFSAVGQNLNSDSFPREILLNQDLALVKQRLEMGAEFLRCVHPANVVFYFQTIQTVGNAGFQDDRKLELGQEDVALREAGHGRGPG